MNSYFILEKLRVKADAFFFRFVRKKFAFVGEGVYVGRLSQLVGAKYIHLQNGVSIGRGTYLCAWDKYMTQTFTPNIDIAENSIIGPFAHITAVDSIKIGKNTLLGKWVTITDNSHGNSSLGCRNTPPTL